MCDQEEGKDSNRPTKHREKGEIGFLIAECNLLHSFRGMRTNAIRIVSCSANDFALGERERERASRYRSRDYSTDLSTLMRALGQVS